MIPYFRFTEIPLGPIHIQVWGLMVVLGIAAAVLLGRHECKRRGLDTESFTDLASWIVVAALLGGRVFAVLAYEPKAFLSDPLMLLRVWEGGMSMFGGLLGGAAAAWYYARKAKVRFGDYADVVAYVLPLGYGIGRIGCFLIHDHPGTLSHFFLAVRYPNGPRLDHGLLLSIAGFALFGAFFVINRRRGKAGRPPGDPSFVALYMVCYGVIRFILDFFRAWDLPGSDARYFSLTPGQYVALALIALGLCVWRGRGAFAHAILPQGRA